MKSTNLKAVYVMWLREQKIFFRSKSRILGTMMMPIMFLIFMGMGFGSASFASLPEGMPYLQFLVPGILGMSLLFRSMFFGVAVIWDRQFGFLKEIMVSPASRVSLMLGRTLGGVTTAMLQGIIILIITLFLGFEVTSVPMLFASTIFMMLIGVTFISLGLIIGTSMKDMEGFGLIMNFVTFPLFFLSGALFPITSLPEAVKFIFYINPLTYGVDGLRAMLIGYSTFPVMLDLAVLSAMAAVMVAVGAYVFDRSEAV